MTEAPAEFVTISFFLFSKKPMRISRSEKNTCILPTFKLHAVSIVSIADKLLIYL